MIEAEKAGEEAFSEEEIQNCRNAMAANVVSAVITLAENVADTRRQASVQLKHENCVNAPIENTIQLLFRHSFLSLETQFNRFMIWVTSLIQTR